MKQNRRRKDRLSKPQGRPQVSLNPVHDRRARVLPENASVRFLEVDDPGELTAAGRAPPDGKIIAVVSLRDDPLGRLHDRGQIDDAQYAAGRHYQALCEAAEVSGVRAMDTTKEPVDGRGAVSFPLTDRQLGAMKALKSLSIAIRSRHGTDGEALLTAVLVERMFLNHVIESRGVPASERSLRNFGWYLRQCLETLAIALGYAQPSSCRY